MLVAPGETRGSEENAGLRRLLLIYEMQNCLAAHTHNRISVRSSTDHENSLLEMIRFSVHVRYPHSRHVNFSLNQKQTWLTHTLKFIFKSFSQSNTANVLFRRSTEKNCIDTSAEFAEILIKKCSPSTQGPIMLTWS